MTANELRRILGAFVNDPSELDIRRDRIVAQIQDDLIDVLLETDLTSGELVVRDGDIPFTPRQWLLRRIAKLDLLAERILAYVPETPALVVPTGRLTGDIANETEEREIDVPNVVACLEERIVNPLPASTTVLYLTSDAGEGKTTLINHVARLQATRCRARRSTTVLLPIPLGGKTFLRFDDVVIGTLSNRFRFNRYYFDGFLELVRLGAIVPAFDGFEEMFVEGHSGEAVSALGTLIGALESSGSMVVAARKAFFEFTSFGTQARLFDSIEGQSASFSRLKINRWRKDQFLEYAALRKIADGEAIYDRFGLLLPADHPMLSRAFLVKRLLDVAEEVSTVDQLVAELGQSPQDYFFKFVETLVEREARLKWLDKTGDISHPLLSVEEHHELLASIAREMWQSSVIGLRLDVVDVLVDLFAESKKKGPSFTRQIRERIRNHSLLSLDSTRGGLLEFDHEEFRRFYLGEAVGRALLDTQAADFLSVLSVDKLAPDTCDQAVNFVDRADYSRVKCINAIVGMARSASPLSYVRENSGALLVRMMSGEREHEGTLEIVGNAFPLDALVAKELWRVRFEGCEFEATWFSGSTFTDVTFDRCTFERIDLFATDSLAGSTFSNCQIRSMRLASTDGERSVYGPREVIALLTRFGATVEDSGQALVGTEASEGDFRVELVERFLRVFLRATQVNEDVLRSRFGKAGNSFFDDVLPALVRTHVVQTVEYRGKGVQNRYKLAVPMQDIQQALAESSGRFDRFLERVAAR